MRKLSGIYLFLVLIAGLVACTHSSEELTGTLTGTVSIGPLCPVEPCSLTDAQRDNIYQRYTLALRRTDTQQTAGVISNLDHTGVYRLTLPAGEYVVICEQCIRKEVTTPFSVPANQVTQKDISVDTGIR